MNSVLFRNLDHYLSRHRLTEDSFTEYNTFIQTVPTAPTVEEASQILNIFSKQIETGIQLIDLIQ